MEEGASMRAVVMAGGEGSRLRPVTANRPKPLAPVCNMPIMEHIVGLLARHGIREIVTTLHYMANEIQTYFGDGSEFDVKMTYSIEDTPLGTAGSVNQAKDRLKDSTFVIVSGDCLTDCDLTDAIRFHREKSSVATLVLKRVPNPLEFGVVITDEEGRVVRFLEKPGWSEVFSDTVNTGMYILEPEVFDLMQPDKVYDWSRDIFPQLLALGRPMYGYITENYWADLGSLTQYREAQHDLVSRKVGLPIPGLEIASGIYLGANCSIDERAQLVPPVVLGRNCKVRAGATIGPYSVIGDNALIEENATIERSVLWDSAYVGPNVDIQSAVCCSRVTIKRDSVVGEDAVIGDRCLLDVGSSIRPRVKLWPDKVIERGATVTMSLVWGHQWRVSLFRELGVGGISNIEVTPDLAVRLGAAYGSCLPPKSRIVTARDSTRSSRMIKRAIIAALLGVGCDVYDMRSAAVPIVRHYTKTDGAAGAVYVRKLPGNTRVTIIEMFDPRGAYLSKIMERKVENAYYREDFKRTDPEDLGVIEYTGRAIEGYQNDFFSLVGVSEPRKPMRVVCDYGYSPVASIFPAMLARLGVESVSLHAYNDAKLAPRHKPDVDRHVEDLRRIVDSLSYDLGVLFTDEGERLTIVDDRGRVIEGNTLLAAMCLLLGKAEPESSVALSVTAPDRLIDLSERAGLQCIRTKADTRSLMNGALDAGVTMAGDGRGGFIHPSMHPGYDAMFGFARLVTLMRQTGLRLGEVIDEVPAFSMAYAQVRCPWESKGTVMREITEQSRTSEKVETLDGIKVYSGNQWALVLPDAVEPLFHVYAESPEQCHSDAIVADYVKRIEKLQAAEN